MYSVSIVIPAYNEEKNIKNTLEQTVVFCTGEPSIDAYEIICVDDGSTDTTREMIAKFQHLNPRVILTPQRKNRGKGFSIKEGIKQAQYDIVLFFDADLSTPLCEIPTFLSAMVGYDIIIGSRNTKYSQIHRSWKRTMVSRIFVLLNRLLCGLSYTDTQCGFKMFKKAAATDIFSRVTLDGFSFDVELLVIAEIKHYRIKEQPITWSEAKRTSVRMIPQSIAMLRDLFSIRKKKRSNVYA